MRNPTDAPDVRPRPGSPLWIYMTAVSVAGAILIGLALWHSNRGNSAWHYVVRHPMFWIVAAMILAGEIWRISTPGRTARSESPAISRTMSVAALMYWGFPIAVVLRALAIGLVGLAQRRGPLRVSFNAAQLSLSLGAARLALVVDGSGPTGRHPWMAPDARSLGGLMLACAAYLAVNFTLVTTAMSLYSRTPIKALVRSNFGYQAATNLVLFGTAPLVTVAMATRSPILVALFAFPLGAIYYSAAMSVQREYQANHDDLTGLLNRKLLARRATDALARAANLGSMAGFLLIDLDRSTGLKQVNDTLGHAVGDRLLQIVAHRLSHSVRPGDVVARLGGDEFAVLLPSVKDAALAREVASRLRAALAEPLRLETMTFRVEASIGIAMYPDDGTNFEQLMQHADVAMYLAKERHTGIERYEAQADRNSADRLAMLGDLRNAIQGGEIELYFQPKVLLADEQVIGMEALARWPHPQRGVLDAAEFIGLADQSHLASELTELVIDKALAQAAIWWADGLPVQVSVNLPARDLLGARLVDVVSQALERHGLEPQALRLDVNEQVLSARVTQAAGAVRELTDLGVGVSLDDYGTGYSSLAQLTRLGISEVKLDPSLVSGLPGCPDRSMTVESLVRLAQSLGIRSIGEGVENDAAATALRALGCDGAQGWHFARPLNAAMASTWLAEHMPHEQQHWPGAKKSAAKRAARQGKQASELARVARGA
jgi:diguanylate cyclase (GGDEF)-like protein